MKTRLDGLSGETELSSKEAGAAPESRFKAGMKVPGHEWYYLRELPEQAGGFGECHLLEDRKDGGLVFMKTPQAFFRDDPAIKRSFKEEALKLVGFPLHPHLVGILGFSEWERLSCLFMEHIKGRTLLAILRSGAPSMGAAAGSTPGHQGGQERVFTTPRADANARMRNLLTLLAIARGMEAAYEVGGTLHLDLSPANILIGDEDACVRVIDFGLAQTLATMQRTRMGTPLRGGSDAYRAPEMALGFERCDTRADIYSFGLLGLTLWLGRPLELGESKSLIPRLQDGGPGAPMPEDHRTILGKCLRERTEDRYQNFRELVEALEGAYYRIYGTLPLTAWVRDDDASIVQRAKAMNDLGRHLEALADLDRALALDPGDSDALFAKASALNGLCRAREAEAILFSMPAHLRREAQWLNLASCVAYSMGDYSAAIGYAKEYERLEPRATYAWSNTLQILIKAYQHGDLPTKHSLRTEILERYRAFKADFPGPKAYEIGSTLAAEGGLAFDIASELKKDLATDTDGFCHSTLAMFHFDRGNLDKAATLIRKARDINPYEDSHGIREAVIVAALGKKEEAGELFFDVFDRDPNGCANYVDAMQVFLRDFHDSEMAAKIHDRYVELALPDELGRRLMDSLSLITLNDPKELPTIGSNLERIRETNPDFFESWLHSLVYTARLVGNAGFVGLVSRMLDDASAATGSLGAFRNAIGHFYYDRGECEEALRLYALALKDDPGNAFYAGNRANSLVKAGKRQEAVALGVEWLQDHGGEANAYFWNALGDAHYETRHYDKAEPCYRRAMELDPENSLYVSNAMSALIEKCKEGEATDLGKAADLGKAWLAGGERSPTHVFWNTMGRARVKLGEWAEAEACFRRALASSPHDAAYAGNILLALNEQGRYGDAAAFGREWRSQEGNEPRAPFWGHLGGACRALGLLEEAEDCHRKAQVLEPASTQWVLALLTDLSALGRHLEAIAFGEAWLDPAISRVVTVELYGAMRDACVQTGRAADADRFAGKQISIYHSLEKRAELVELAEDWLAGGGNSLSGAAWNMLGLAYLKLERFDEAIAAFKRASAIDPADATFAGNLVTVLADQDRPEEADSFAKSWQVSMERRLGAVIWNTVGQACIRCKDLEMAENCFREALEAAPDNASLFFSLLDVLYALGKHHELIDVTESWLAVAGRKPHKLCWNRLAMAYHRCGNATGLERCAREALAIDPESGVDASNVLTALIAQGRLKEALLFGEEWLAVPGRTGPEPLVNEIARARELIKKDPPGPRRP